MTDLHQPRIAPGIPAGGQFATKQHSDADIALASPPSRARDAFEGLTAARRRIESQLMDAAVDATREAIAVDYPDAASFTLSWVEDFDDSHAEIDGIFDGDGRQIDADLSPYHSFVSYIDDWDSFRHIADRSTEKATIEMVRPDTGGLDLEWRRSYIEDDRADLERREYELAVDKTAFEVRLVVPDAASIQLVNANDGPGSPYFVVFAIEDAAGVVKWQRGEELNTITDALDNHSAALDRRMDRIEVVDRDRWRFRF